MEQSSEKGQPRKIALIGDLCLDIFLQIPEYPEKGGDGLAHQMIKQAGGSVSNTAIGLAHFGYKPYLITHTGKDPWAKMVLKILSEEGVVLERVLQCNSESTGLTFLAVTPDGERTMFTYRGANALLKPEEISADLFDNCSNLHLSGYACLTLPQCDAVVKAVDLAVSKGVGITLDIGVEPAHKMGDTLLRMLPHLEVLVLGEPEAIAISGKKSAASSIDFLMEHGVKVVALKLGKDGCQLTTAGKQVLLPGFCVEVVDTTGSGDAFSAAMIYGVLEQLSLEATGLLANAAGALGATRWGAGALMPRKEEIVRFLELSHNQTKENRVWIEEVIDHLSHFSGEY